VGRPDEPSNCPALFPIARTANGSLWTKQTYAISGTLLVVLSILFAVATKCRDRNIIMGSALTLWAGLES
jgi:hypothetical protein